MTRSRGTPCLIADDASPAQLERLTLGAGTYSEDWLQALIHTRPELLPIVQIEPGFGTPVAAAREIACGHGYIDNLYLTPAGEIILVETKLWANPQARREVVAQALDYVAALMRLGYDAFEAAVAAAMDGPRRLYDLVRDLPDALPEKEFVDAVALNLSRGRMLVIALGDGIRREAEALGQLLQSHAGAHFTFALVELQAWRNRETGDLLIVPDTLAQTVMIERGIVRLDHGRMEVVPVPTEHQQKRAESISDGAFFEKLAARSAALPQQLRSFIAQLEPLGVYPDLRAALSLKVDLPDAPRPLNIGFIDKSAKLWTNPAGAWADRDAALAYNQRLASLIGGIVSDKGGDISVTTNGTSAPHLDQLLPAHADAWRDAIAAFIAAEQKALTS